MLKRKSGSFLSDSSTDSSSEDDFSLEFVEIEVNGILVQAPCLGRLESLGTEFQVETEGKAKTKTKTKTAVAVNASPGKQPAKDSFSFFSQETLSKRKEVFSQIEKRQKGSESKQEIIFGGSGSSFSAYKR